MNSSICTTVERNFSLFSAPDAPCPRYQSFSWLFCGHFEFWQFLKILKWIIHVYSTIALLGQIPVCFSLRRTEISSIIFSAGNFNILDFGFFFQSIKISLTILSVCYSIRRSIKYQPFYFLRIWKLAIFQDRKIDRIG